MQKKRNKWTITNVPKEVERDAKVNAALRGQKDGQYVTEALRYYNSIINGEIPTSPVK